MIQQDLFGDSAIIQQNPLTDRRVGQWKVQEPCCTCKES